MQPGYVDLVGKTIGEGTSLPSRYGDTLERRNVTVAVMAGEFPSRPRLNPRIGLMEGLFLVGTFFDLNLIKAIAPSADHSLFTEGGAYGPRIRAQLPRMMVQMAKDPDSRQHILYVAHEGDQYQTDTPCTSNIQFLVRGGFVNCVVNMRSSDIIKGLPTDLIQFGFLTQVVAYCLSLPAGVVAVNAASSHIYTADMDKVPTEGTTRERRFEIPFLPDLGDLPPHERLGKYQEWAIAEAHKAPWLGYLPVEVMR